MLTPEEREKTLDALHGALSAICAPDEVAAEWRGLQIAGLADEFIRDTNGAVRALNARLVGTKAQFRVVPIGGTVLASDAAGSGDQQNTTGPPRGEAPATFHRPA